MEMEIYLFFPNTHTYEKAASFFSFSTQPFGKVPFLFLFLHIPVSSKSLAGAKSSSPTIIIRPPLYFFLLLYLGLVKTKEKQEIVDQPLFF